MMIYDNEECRVKLPNGPKAGLYEFLREQGILMEGGESGEYASDPKVAQAIIDSWTDEQSVEWAIEKKKADIAAFATAARNQAIAGMSPVEIAAWIVKQQESKDLAASPYLDKEALARGIPVSELAGKVQTKFSSYMDKEAQIAGISGKHRDVVASMTVAEDIINYDFSEGWPE